MNVFATLRNAWKSDDLRKKIIFTALIIILFRIGTSIPVPFLNAEAIANFFNPQAGGSTTANLFGYFNMLSGNALSMGVVFALTIQPYINASIIVQLLTIAIPALERLQKDGGEEGKRTLSKITRWLSVAIGIIQAAGYYTILKYSVPNALNGEAALIFTKGDWQEWAAAIVIVLTLVAGSCLVMWLGESIDKKGIGNGISMILFASIVARGSSVISSGIGLAANGQWYVVLIVGVVMLLMLGFIVYMDSAERRIPIQYAKRQVGRKMYGGQSTFLPIKVAMTGVMPIIFTFAIIGVPATIAQFLPSTSGFTQWIEKYFSQTSALYIVLTFVLIIAFNYFYIAIQYNPVEIANNIKSNGGTIPGIRPGKPTSDFIVKCVNKVTLFGALFLGVIAILPYIIQCIFPDASGIALGGTSVLILVSVALETVRKLESQMLMRHYKGFLD